MLSRKITNCLYVGGSEMNPSPMTPISFSVEQYLAWSLALADDLKARCFLGGKPLWPFFVHHLANPNILVKREYCHLSTRYLFPIAEFPIPRIHGFSN